VSHVVTQEDVLPVAPADASGPLVAVLVSLNFPDMDEHLAGLVRQLTRTALQTLADVGARPWLVDLTGPDLPTVAELRAADGIVLLGGGDMDPALYGHDGEMGNAYGVDRAADDYSIAAIRSAFDVEQPVLAICRGIQVLNVACGGTLMPDIVEWSLHRGADHDGLFIDERIRLDPSSQLATMAGADQLLVRTGHHQAVDRVGDGLRAVGWADDGIVEAVEHEQHLAIGVQWHPEQESASHDDRRRLFGAYVAALSRQRAR
jgi:putative glutamine amidotransferase